MNQNAKASLLLSDLQQDQRGTIKMCVASGVLKQKLLNMGFIPGAEVLMIRNAPLRDPIEIGIQNYLLTVRRSEAKLIRVEVL
ncbi:MAG: ferrous iron transport protein A [Thermodesulfobacteriota bacterium]|nr:ferrous iron transport protein A [Thermodesulfobacteriota bacterium]